MGIFSKFFEKMVYKGGILATGIAGLYLYKKEMIPFFMGPISYGITTLGIIGVLTYYMTEEPHETDDDPDYEARMAEFQRLKPELERKIKEQTRLFIETERYIRLRNCSEEWLQDSKAIDERIADIETDKQRTQPAASKSAILHGDKGGHMQPSTSKAVIGDVDQGGYAQLQPSSSKAATVGDVVQGEHRALQQSTSKSPKVKDVVLQIEHRRQEYEIEAAEDVVLGLQQQEETLVAKQIEVEQKDEDSTSTEYSKEFFQTKSVDSDSSE